MIKNKTQDSFSAADKIVKLDLRNNRLIPNAMEPRACIGDYNPSSDELTLYTTKSKSTLI